MRGFRRLAAVTMAATFGLIVFGAVVRGTGSGLACPDWPRCYGLWLPTPESLAAVGGTEFGYDQVMLEWTHRLIAGFIVGPLVVWLTVWAIALRREARVLAPLMVVALGLVAVQAALGGVTVLQGNSPLSVAAHLSVALVFFATLILTFLFTERRTGLDALADALGPGARSLAGLALLATLVTIASGAFTAKGGASFACESWPLCEGWELPDLTDPLVRVHFGHRLLALATAALVTLLYVAARRRRFDELRFHREARLAFLLVLLEVALGAVVVVAGVPLWGAVLHQATGALVFAALAVAFLRPFARRQRFGPG